jgi:hypothetical protein
MIIDKGVQGNGTRQMTVKGVLADLFNPWRVYDCFRIRGCIANGLNS